MAESLRAIFLGQHMDEALKFWFSISHGERSSRVVYAAGARWGYAIIAYVQRMLQPTLGIQSKAIL
jgi:hypothetical protein